MTSCGLKDILTASQSHKVPRRLTGLLDHCIFMSFDKWMWRVQTVQVAGYLSMFTLKNANNEAANQTYCNLSAFQLQFEFISNRS